MEYWDIYDAEKRPTGRTMKRNDWCLKDGEYHLTVLGVVARPDGTYLITKRVMTKAWAPGWWEVSGGAAQAGESSEEAVCREVREETGLDISNAEGGYVSTYKRENPMYAYKVYNNFKIYRPLADKYTKWRNNLTDYDIQGYEQLPQKGDILFITKSMKDVMCLHEMGYPAVSPSSESTFLPKDVLEQLKTRFKRIIILFDRDVAGVKRSRKLSRETGLEAMFINKKFKAKDISDAVKANNFEEIKNWLNETIKNYR